MTTNREITMQEIAFRKIKGRLLELNADKYKEFFLSNKTIGSLRAELLHDFFYGAGINPDTIKKLRVILIALSRYFPELDNTGESNANRNRKEILKAVIVQDEQFIRKHSNFCVYRNWLFLFGGVLGYAASLVAGGFIFTPPDPTGNKIIIICSIIMAVLLVLTLTLLGAIAFSALAHIFEPHPRTINCAPEALSFFEEIEKDYNMMNAKKPGFFSGLLNYCCGDNTVVTQNAPSV